MKEIYERRSVRKFTDAPVSEEQVMRLLQAGMAAPSAVNCQPWEFLVLRSQEDREIIASISPHAQMAKQAPVVIMTIANVAALGKIDRWWPMDMSACTQNILLQAVTEGLGSCWCAWYPMESFMQKTREAFGIPETHVPFSVVCIGYPGDDGEPMQKFKPERIHYDRY